MIAARSLVRLAVLSSFVFLQACGSSDKKDTTPPTIVTTSIANSATGVVRNATFVVTFSEPVAAGSVTSSTIVWLQGSTPVPYAAVVAGAVVSLTPTGALANYTEYSVQITAGVTDVAGNPLAAPTTIAFTTIDDVAPGAPGTPTHAGAYSTSTTATFDWTAATDPTPGTGVVAYRLKVATATDGSGVAYEETTNANGTALTRSVPGLIDGSTYYAQVAAVDGAGNTQPSGWSGGVTVDTSPPTVVSTSIADAATGVARSTTFAATFSEPVAASSVTSSTIVWQTAGGTPVAVPYTVSIAGSTVTLTPVTQPLANYTQYTVQITAGVTDVAGNALAAASVQTIGFTTADDVAPGSPGAPTDVGAWSTSTTVAFSWTGSTDPTPGAGVAAYRLKVATATDGSGIAYDETTNANGTALTRNVPGLIDGSTYYAQVTAVDGAGNAQPSGWSDGITVDATVPTVPGVASLPSEWVRGGIVYTWTGSTDAGSGIQGYLLHVSTTTADNGSGVIAANMPPGSGMIAMPTSGQPDGQTLYARVAAVDNANNVSAWAAWSAVARVDNGAPTAPGVVVDAGDWSGSSVALSWAAASDPSPGSGLAPGYSLQVATAPDAGAVVETLPSPGTSEVYYATSPGSWPEGGYLYARAQATDIAGNTTWGSWSDGIRIDRTAPSVPGTPTDAGIYSLSSTLRFDWAGSSDAGSGVASYWLQAATATDGTGLTLFDGTVGNSLLADVVATNGQTVYARVKAIDGAGNESWSGWSNGIMVDLEAPPVPDAPAASVACTVNLVTFTWPDVVDPESGLAGYSAQLSSTTAADGSGVFGSNYLTAATWTIGATSFEDGINLYARVRSNDRVGHASAWSGWSPAVCLDKSGPVFASAPTDAGAVTLPSARFDWIAPVDAGSGLAVGYTVMVNTLPTDVWPASTFDVTTTFGIFDASNALLYPDGTVLYARVMAADLLGNLRWSGWSDGVTIDRAPPSVPGAPNDPGARQRELDVLFSWAPSIDDVSGVRDYTIHVKDETDTVVASATVTGTSYLFTGVDGKTYYAQVLSTDNLGNASVYGSWSDGIVIDTSVPGTPGVPNDDGVFNNSTILGFNWSAAAGTLTGYVLEIGTSPGLANVVSGFPVGGLAVGYDVGPAGFANGTTYYARVAATDGGVQGGWSDWSNGVTVDTTQPGIPGIPTDRGAVDDRYVTFNWTLADDVESGVATYESEVLANGWFLAGTSSGPANFTTFDAAAFPGWTLTARVRAQNGAGTWGDWSAFSDGIVVDSNPPWVNWSSPNNGATQVATNVDLSVYFSEPMDAASVEAATSLSWGAGGPAHGLVFYWNVGQTRVTIIPDAADPAGITNVDLLPQQTAIQLTIGIGAKDAAGNPLSSPYTASFTTADETPPQLVSLTIGTEGSPFPAASVQGPFTLVATFDEDMNTSQGSLRIELPQGSIENGTWTSARTLAFSGGATFSLPPASEARVTINNVSDVAGNWTWAEGLVQVAPLPGTDTLGPTLVSAIPLDGAVGVTRTSPVILRFSEPLDAASVAGSFAVDGAGRPYTMRYTSDEMGPVIFFVPLAAPADGATVSVQVPATVTDLAGNPLLTQIDLSFEVAAKTDFGVPVLYESQPPDARPVDEIWQASALVADEVTGMLEQLDSRSVGSDDILVTDVGTGLPVRGYRLTVEPGSGALQIQTPPRGAGFSTGWGNTGIQSSTASGGIATFTTYGDHGLQVGWQVQVQGTSLGCFDGTATVLTVATSTTFTLPTSCGDGSSGTGGSANWRTPRTLVVELAVAPAAGGTGILDFEGNPMDPTGFTALMTPAGTNRVPTVDSLRDLRIGVTTSPLGRQLSAQFRVRDADDDAVTVSMTALGGALALTGPMQVLTNTRNSVDYRYGNGGPPMGASPPELDDTNFPTSDYYSFEITLDDGTDVTTYVRQVWVWAPADVPAVESINDGGTVRFVDVTRPIVVENTVSPVVAWSNVDSVNADFIALQYLELSAANIGNSGGPRSLALDRSVTSAPFPVQVEPTIYAWFATQMKFSPGEMNPETQGWSLDFGRILESAFVYGPSNRSFAGRQYGAARAGLARDQMTGSFASAWDATGTYAIEPLPAGGTAPVAVAVGMTRNDGTTSTTGEFFAAAPDGSFMVTTTSSAMMNLPLANRGFVGRNGRFFAIVAQDQTTVGIEAGAYRDPAMLPAGSITGTTFSFVQTEVRTNPDGSLNNLSASIGDAVAGATEVEVSLWRNDGGTMGPFPVPYTLGLDGLFRMDLSGIGTEHVSGYLGGAPGAEFAVLAADDNARLSFFLIMARKYPWLGIETAGLLSGDYRFAEYTVGAVGGGGALGEVHASSGMGHFDGAGGFTYQVSNSGGTRIGTGTYTVDPVAGQVTLIVDPGPEQVTFLLTLAADADTVFGVSRVSADVAQILVFSK